MRSISTKLIIAFLSIGVISVAVIFSTARWNTRQEFIKFLSDQSQSSIVTSLTSYYQLNGSWDGVEFFFFQGNNRPNPGMGMGQGPRMDMMQPFTLTDKNGVVIISNGRFTIGEKIPKEET